MAERRLSPGASSRRPEGLPDAGRRRGPFEFEAREPRVERGTERRLITSRILSVALRRQSPLSFTTRFGERREISSCFVRNAPLPVTPLATTRGAGEDG